MDHPLSCNCERCVGIRRYPQPAPCDWCGGVHSGDANNCPDSPYNIHEVVENLDDPVVDMVVRMVERHLGQTARIIRRHMEATMSLSAKDILKRQAANTEGGALLHGSDVPKGTKAFKVTCTGVREAPPNFNAAIILDIKEVFGCNAMAINKTNLLALVEKFGDDLDKVKGKTFSVDVVSTNNPSTKKLTRGLRVSV